MNYIFSQPTLLALFFALVSTFDSWGQVAPSETNFRSPMDIPLIVSGNFGEVRTNHFHTGIDFKSQGVEGKNIYAIDSGYISRIAYSHYGYGKALYVTHPNGYTSVYAHLSKFKGEIGEYVKNYQYAVQQETFNVYLDSNKIKVKRGQIIALSGNSGSSGAPHLHFEIRQTGSEHPMNPLLFGYKIKDVNKPMINNLKIYPMDEFALVNGKTKSEIIPVKKNKSGKYYLPKNITAYGNVGFALHSTDRLNARNICGLYTLDLSVNGMAVFGHKMDELDFSTSRFSNHHVDYRRHKLYNNSFHKSFLQGNNPLEIYFQVNDGITYVDHDSSYLYNYVAKDFVGNTSRLDFRVKGDSTGFNKLAGKETSCANFFSYNESNYLKVKEFDVLMTPNTLYENGCVTYKRRTDSLFLSAVHTVGNRFMGVQKTYKIMIEPTVAVDSNLLDKLLIVKIDEKGKIADRGGDLQEGFVTTRVKEMGSFAISMDTTMPVVNLLSKLDKVTANSTLVFKIGDNLSGISSYSATLNGEWILTEYKRKKGRWYVSLSEGNNLTKGKHSLQVEVVDERGNSNLQTIELELK